MIKNKKDSNKGTWLQYAIFAAVAIALYATGMHTEVIGFAQRGLLETGLMNPDVTEKRGMTPVEKSEPESFKEVNRDPEASFDLQLRDSEGNIVPLSQFKGKVIFMNFWATWCPPCIAEIHGINKLHDEMGDDVVFVMLSMDQDFEKALTYVERKGYDLPVYNLAGRLPAMYRSSALPTTFVIDGDGHLALTHKGMADYNTDEFKEFLRGLK